MTPTYDRKNFSVRRYKLLLTVNILSHIVIVSEQIIFHYFTSFFWIFAVYYYSN